MLKKPFFSDVLVVLLVLTLATALFVPGCSSSRRFNSEAAIGGFLGGTQGLAIHVMEGAPPKVIVGSGAVPFSFIIPLENVGESPVGPGTDNPLIMARLTGIVYRNFGLTEETGAQTLDAKIESAKVNYDGTVLPGEINYISFDKLAYLPPVYDTIMLPIRAEVCYDYESFATTQFCMKKDVLESWEDSTICTLKGPKPVGNSGSPIHITYVEEAPISNQTVQLNFVIEHVGRGVFFIRNAYSSLYEICDFGDVGRNMYKVEVFVEPLQPDIYVVNCTRLDTRLSNGGTSGIVRMFEGAPLTMTCFLSRTKPMNVRVYADLLNIRLRYRYGEFVEVPILIQSHP